MLKLAGIVGVVPTMNYPYTIASMYFVTVLSIWVHSLPAINVGDAANPDRFIGITVAAAAEYVVVMLGISCSSRR